ncbi:MULTISPECIES: hypothetical protein [unclassified Mycobacteroides]|uniref:hypothetical protein n=1 Tax=unclassified Mycobacteroides TaxID=2618759 RepID=UPI0035C7ED24
MSLNTWPAVLAITGAVVFSCAACGGSENNSARTSAAPASTIPTRHAGSRDHVGGLITAVTGHSITVTTPGEPADIDFNAMTKITEIQPAELSDVVVGSCVSVLSATGADTSTEATAQRVLISASEDDKCAVDTPPGSAPPPGVPPGPPPPGEGPPPAGPGAPPPFGGPNAQGAVASVNGDTIVIANTDPSGASEIQTNVAVTADTKYDRRQPAEATAITAGKCAEARGTKNSERLLQATKLDLGPATDGHCGPPKP